MATKAEVIEQLTALGIAHDPDALKSDLEALLPVPSEMASEATPVSSETLVTEVGVHDVKGRLHRTYSKELHGENFQALAEQYVSNKPGWTVK